MSKSTESIPEKLLSWSESSALASIVIAFVALMVLGYIDFATGYELNLVLFYVFPIMLATWAAGRRAGVLLAALAALTWLWVDAAGGHTYNVSIGPYWNAVMRLSMFILIVQLVLLLKHRVDTEKARSLTDSLTGIANRRAFTDALNEEISRSKRFSNSFSLAFIDVDRFKSLNDRRGHSEGDRALVLIARALKTSLRDIDLVARIGGDEFAILLPASDSAAARHAVTRCFKTCTDLIDREDWGVSLSAGIGTFLDSSLNSDEMLSHVDQIMYRGKQKEQNTICTDTTEQAAAGHIAI